MFEVAHNKGDFEVNETGNLDYRKGEGQERNHKDLGKFDSEQEATSPICLSDASWEMFLQVTGHNFSYF